MDSTKRFSNKTGEEYDLFSMALPHQDIIQKRVSEILSQHYSADKYKEKEKEIIETLEIGFGTGLTTQAMLSKDARVRITAVDNEPLMFAQASDKLRSYPKERLTLHTIDVFDYLKKIESNSFDAVASAWTLHNFHNDFRNKVLKEIYRVLKPDAIFINGDKMAVSDPHIHQAHLDWQIKRFDIFDTIQKPEVKKQWTEHYLEDEDPDRILYEEKFIRELISLGFLNIKVTDRVYMESIVSGIKG